MAGAMLQVNVQGSEELQHQIELLKLYPEIVNKYFAPAMRSVAVIVEDAIRPLVPTHTGYLVSTLGSKVKGKEDSKTFASAHIGFGRRYNKPPARYNAPLNQGAAPHEVTPRRGEYLHFSSQAQGHTQLSSMYHPGFSPRGYMEAGLENAMPAVNAEMNQAAEEVMKELAK